MERKTICPGTDPGYCGVTDPEATCEDCAQKVIGKLTIIVESNTRTSRQLDERFQHLLRPITDKYARVYIVPSDEVPYDGPDYPPGTNAGLP